MYIYIHLLLVRLPSQQAMSAPMPSVSFWYNWKVWKPKRPSNDVSPGRVQEWFTGHFLPIIRVEDIVRLQF
jgi:hypothetical protein